MVAGAISSVSAGRTRSGTRFHGSNQVRGIRQFHQGCYHRHRHDYSHGIPSLSRPLTKNAKIAFPSESLLNYSSSAPKLFFLLFFFPFLSFYLFSEFFTFVYTCFADFGKRGRGRRGRGRGGRGRGRGGRSRGRGRGGRGRGA